MTRVERCRIILPMGTKWADMTEDQRERQRAHARAWKAANPGRHQNETRTKEGHERGAARAAAQAAAREEKRRLADAAAAERAYRRTRCSRCGEPRDVPRYTYCRACRLARANEWKAANPERAREHSKQSKRNWSLRNPDKVRASKARARRSARARGARWIIDARRRSDNLRRARLAGVADKIVRLDMNGPCGVCGEQIDPNERHQPGGLQNPLAVTVGHEPPLSRAQAGDVIYERPEHWRCNWEKGDRTDDELLDSLLQPAID